MQPSERDPSEQITRANDGRRPPSPSANRSDSHLPHQLSHDTGGAFTLLVDEGSATPAAGVELTSVGVASATADEDRAQQLSSSSVVTGRRFSAGCLDKCGFYAFLIIFYVCSKGLSQLFANYVANQEHLAAPIYLTTCEYAMWVLLGSIHRFTLDQPPEEPSEADGLLDAANSSSSIVVDESTPCECDCRCRKCRQRYRPPVVEVWPTWRVSVAYLIGELTKTVLEVMTVAQVELSLALVLLATAPLFSILFRGIFERKRPKPNEWIIVLLVSTGLMLRIPEIQHASVGSVFGGLISAAAAAWISSFKSLIFDPPTAPHVLNYMYRFGPLLVTASLILCVSVEIPALKVAFRNRDESIETLAFGMLFALLAAPSSVVSKRLQKWLGSFQRTLLGVANNVLVAFISVALASTGITPLMVIGSLFVFAAPAANYIDWGNVRQKVERWTSSMSARPQRPPPQALL